MKNILLIILLIFITFWAINLLDHKEPYYFDIINNINVTVNKTEIDLMTSKQTSYFRWFYEYKIDNETMYITTYKVVNPLSKSLGPQLKINIPKGYNDVNEIYLNAEGENRLIWKK